MKAAIWKDVRVIEVGDRPDPVIQAPTDAIIRVVRGCVCGSDLHFYRGIIDHHIGAIGHEFIGVVETVGDDVTNVAAGDLVIAPFTYNDGVCPNCLAGFPSECDHGGAFSNDGTDGGQGEKVRSPFADGTLVKVPSGTYSDDQLASFTALCDVMCTGHHAAVSAGVKQGDVVAVIGDGAVGLSAVISAKMLGASRIIMLSRNADRQAMATEFGATDILTERGDQAIEAVLRLTAGTGVDAALECVGSDESISTCAGITRPGGMIGAVGVPLYDKFQYATLFWKNIGIRGGTAPARTYAPMLLDRVLDGTINPGRVFDLVTDLDDIAEAYVAMDERRAIKTLLKISEP